MNRLRDPRWCLIVMFLAILGGVPLVQVILELRQGDGVRALEVLQQPPTAARLRAYEQNLEAANWAARMGRPWVQFAQFEVLGYGGAKAFPGLDGWLFYKPGLQDMLARTEVSTAPMSVGAVGPLGVGREGGGGDPVAAIVGFRDQLAARGIRLMVLPVPNKESVYPDRVTARASALRGVMAPRTRQVFARLRAEDVEVVDLFQRFAEARRGAGAAKVSPLYLAQDTHWSPDGVDLAARTVAARLRELGWVRAGAVEYDVRPVTVRRLGDVVRMLQVPALERRIPPETVECRQVLQGVGGAPYQDAAEADVLLLGDSFLRVYQADAPGAAGFIAQLARELGQPMLSLVNDGGGSTLVRRELQSRPVFLSNRKVVVWEFVERDLGLGVEGWATVPLPPIVDPVDVGTAPARVDP